MFAEKVFKFTRFRFVRDLRRISNGAISMEVQRFRASPAEALAAESDDRICLFARIMLLGCAILR